MIQFDIDIKKNLCISDMRTFVLDQIKEYGTPLRWSIAELTASDDNNSSKLKIEATIIIQAQ
tara:strand:- start:11128 stop:11313 length:186 start_codon:yes stop_codon:yes gene_type:complete